MSFFNEASSPSIPIDSDTECLENPSSFVNSQSLFSMSKSGSSCITDSTEFIRNVVICILSECMNELSILRSINLQNDLGTNPNNLLTYMSIEERYMGQENHADFRIDSTDNNFDKLAKDINMLYVVLEETCLELQKSSKYKIMEDTVRIVNQMYAEETQLLEDEANQERIIEELRNRYEQERLENIRTIEETDAKIQELKFQVEDIYIYGQQEVQYFSKWENTRIEQNLMKCREKEGFYEKTIRDTTEQILLENRCHNELETYFETTRTDYLEEIQYWMKKYDEEIDQREGDTINLRVDLEKIIEERKIMTEKYEKRQAEINDWLEYKRVKEAKEKQRAREIQAVKKIQAWWRGVMVRKKLGPYSKKKKGKGKGKDKGKDKKKGKK